MEYQAGKAVVDSLACENGNDADERDVTLVQVRGFFGSPTKWATQVVEAGSRWQGMDIPCLSTASRKAKG